MASEFFGGQKERYKSIAITFNVSPSYYTPKTSYVQQMQMASTAACNHR